LPYYSKVLYRGWNNIASIHAVVKFIYLQPLKGKNPKKKIPGTKHKFTGLCKKSSPSMKITLKSDKKC
jgi:hypothetical protein